MPSSTNFDAAKAMEAVVKKYGKQFVEELHFGNPSAALDVTTPFAGNKGILVINRYEVFGDNVYNYTSTFKERDSAKVSPISIVNHRVKQEFSADPGEMEENYTGMMRAPGQNPEDNPLYKLMVDGHIAKGHESNEKTMWQGKRIAENLINEDTPLIDCVNGFGHWIDEAITANNLTPVATGPIDATNIIEQFRAMYSQLHVKLKAKGVTLYASTEHEEDYKIARIAFAQHNSSDFNTIKYDTGNMTIKFLPGMEKNKIAITYPGNMARSMDNQSDEETIITHKGMYKQQYGIVYRLGTKILVPVDDHIVVNDQWVA